MKYYLILILISSSFTVFGQVPINLDKATNFDSWTAPASRVDKLRILDELRDVEPLGWIFAAFEHGDSSNISSLHIVDFDCDGISDLIYDGFVGAESNRVIFLKGNSNGSYTNLIGLWGRLIEISENDGFSPMSFVIFNYACCAGTIDHIERYIPIWDDLDFGYKLQAKFTMYSNLDFPTSRLKKPIGFKTNNEKYYLRINPFIDDSILLEHDEEGNKFAEYPKDSEGIALAEQTDETGRVWWFVMMKNNIKPNWSLHANGDNNEVKSYPLGWISSRYVKRLE